MGGMKSLFTKIIPIIMLVCFICLGITHTFGRFDAETGQSNITYLSKDTIETGTQDHPYELTYYELDVNGYMQGMNNDFLHRSIQDVIDIETYTNVLNSFNALWEDGYDFLDGIYTIINAVILTIDTALFLINILLVPLRIISGILLTSFSLIGINTSQGGVLINSLNAIIDHAAIPFIEPTINKGYMNSQTWLFKATITTSTDLGTEIDAQVNFTTQGGGIYVAMFTRNGKLYYKDRDGNEIAVYQNNAWVYTDSKTIYNLDIDNLNNLQMRTFMAWLKANATSQ